MRETHQRYSKLERIAFGRPAAAAVAVEAELVEARRILILSNRSLAAEGTLLRQIAAALGDRVAGTITTLKAQSPSVDVLAVAHEIREKRADLLLAVGGGSVIDTAKVALVAVIDDHRSLAGLRTIAPYADVDQSFWPPWRGAAPLRLLVVPTTLSSAEFNWGASFLDEAAGIKYAVGHPLMVPQAVILDPGATLTTPDALFFGTGMKAVDHAAERLAANAATPFSDATAAEALALLGRALRRVRQERNDLEARLEAQTGTWLSVAGQTSGVPVGASHPIGRILSTLTEVPHGFTTGLILPAVMRWNLPANATRQKRIAAALGGAGEDAAAAVAGLAQALGLPVRLRDAGVAPTIFPEIARRGLGESGIRNNPRPIRDAADILAILELAW